MRSGVGCLTNRASWGPENHTALSCVSVTSFEIGNCCIRICTASPILICCPGSFWGADGCYGFFFPISKICDHDFDWNDIETEGGFRNCGHFHKMKLPPPSPGRPPRAWYGSVHKSCAPLFLSHYLFSVMLLRRESRPSFPS